MAPTQSGARQRDPLPLRKNGGCCKPRDRTCPGKSPSFHAADEIGASRGKPLSTSCLPDPKRAQRVGLQAYPADGHVRRHPDSLFHGEVHDVHRRFSHDRREHPGRLYAELGKIRWTTGLARREWWMKTRREAIANDVSDPSHTK